jgi:hypothetical protein
MPLNAASAGNEPIPAPVTEVSVPCPIAGIDDRVNALRINAQRTPDLFVVLPMLFIVLVPFFLIVLFLLHRLSGADVAQSRIIAR